MTQDPDPVLSAANARLAEQERIVRELGEAIARIERERARVRPEDWDTLFRQMAQIMVDLATHPFLAGDVHAETLIERMAVSDDLEIFDKRVTELGEYVAGKLAYHEALRAVREGRMPDPALLVPRTFGATAPGAGRIEAQAGPSGSDFELSGTAEPVAVRRDILRL